VVVRLLAPAIHARPLFGERGLRVDVGIAVQVVEVAGDDHPLGVLPGTLADAVARVHAIAGAEIRTPGAIAGAGGLGEGLAALVRALQPAQVGAAVVVRGDKEAHAVSVAAHLRATCSQNSDRDCRDKAANHTTSGLVEGVRRVHFRVPLSSLLP
jgi:hypothetical protein